MSAELAISHLCKQYPGVASRAIDDVSLTIAAGEILALLGPSGCGKTTTLRSVAGLEHPTAGTIRIGGERVADPANGVFVPPQHRNLGMVFQSYAVRPHMTVRQNVEYPLAGRKIRAAERRRLAGEALELVGLQAYAERPVVALSGGQMQRVALARSLAYRPALLLLDEPLSNLDAKLRIRLRDDLRRIIKDAGVTALYVTHDQAEAVVIGDRIGVMKDGALLQVSTPLELYNAPADAFVATFTGAASVLQARVERGGGDGALVKIEGSDLPVMALPADDPALSDADRVQVSIRPENVRLQPAPSGGAGMTGRVRGMQYQGTQTLYSLDLYGQRIEVVELGTRPRFAPGDAVAVCLPSQGASVFAARAEA